MEKRYQVFVSSTYTDLLQERAEVMQALLELNCMPAGMEIFPAANDDQWSWIKRVIDESDYYISIVGGRYGSISKITGLSYTEMKYNYAIEIGKPVIGFIHKSFGEIPGKKLEKNQENILKLEAFCEKVKQKLCRFWENPSDLGAKVSRSLTQLMKQYPTTGWVRSDEVINSESNEVLRLRLQIEELQNRLSKFSAPSDEKFPLLAKDSDLLDLHFSYDVKIKSENEKGRIYWKKVNPDQDSIGVTWVMIFTIFANHLISPTAEWVLYQTLNSYISQEYGEDFESRNPDHRILNIQLFREIFRTIIVQFKLLGYIRPYENSGEWMLSDAGEQLMAEIVGVKRDDGNAAR